MRVVRRFMSKSCMIFDLSSHYDQFRCMSLPNDRHVFKRPDINMITRTECARHGTPTVFRDNNYVYFARLRDELLLFSLFFVDLNDYFCAYQFVSLILALPDPSRSLRFQRQSQTRVTIK